MRGDYLIPDLGSSESPKVGNMECCVEPSSASTRTGSVYRDDAGRNIEPTSGGSGRQANRMMDKLTEQLKVLNGVTEQMKAEDQIWVGLMNSIRHSAEEVKILRDLIYA